MMLTDTKNMKAATWMARLITSASIERQFPQASPQMVTNGPK